MASIACAAYEEMAWGLAGSGAPFLWVMRPGLVIGSAAGAEPGERKGTPTAAAREGEQPRRARS